MSVFPLKIPLVKPDLPLYAEIAPMLEDAISSGRLTNFGRYSAQFEALVSERLGSGCYAVSVSSGTVALILTLQALGVGPGSEVILPSYTFTATAQALLYLGAIPVFAEVRADLTICPDDLAKILERTPSVVAVVGVHVHGVVCDIEAIAAVVRQAESKAGQKIALIFDAAHAFGAERNGIKAGNFGDAEVFSLSVTKVLVCGEGGLITTKNAALIEKLRTMRNYGVASAYNATEMGLNGKFSELHAAIGCINITRLDSVLVQRQHKAARYRALLAKQVPGISFSPLPATVFPTWKDFNIFLHADQALRRTEIVARLQVQGVETRAYFSPPVHRQTHFRRYTTRALPVTDDASARVLTLPFFTSICDEQVNQVVQALKNAVAD